MKNTQQSNKCQRPCWFKYWGGRATAVERQEEPLSRRIGFLILDKKNNRERDGAEALNGRETTGNNATIKKITGGQDGGAMGEDEG